MCHVLSRFGRKDIAYELLMQDTIPPLYPVTMGATTIWERWDGIKPDGSFQNPGMNLFNHYAWRYRVDDKTLLGSMQMSLLPAIKNLVSNSLREEDYLSSRKFKPLRYHYIGLEYMKTNNPKNHHSGQHQGGILVIGNPSK